MHDGGIRETILLGHQIEAASPTRLAMKASCQLGAKLPELCSIIHAVLKE